MTWRPKTFAESLFPVRTFDAIMGFGVFQYPVGHQRVLFSVVYGITVTIIYWVSFGMAVKMTHEDPNIDTEGFLAYYVIYVHFVISLVAQFVILCNINKYDLIVERITSVDETLSELGTTFDYTKCMNFCTMNIVCWIVMASCQNAIDVLWFYDQFSFGEVIYHVSILHHPVHTNTLLLINFAFTISLIGQRFNAANKLLEDKFKIVDRYFISNNLSIFTSSKVKSIQLNTSMCRTARNNKDQKVFLQTIKHIHLELTLIAKDMNKLYGLLIILELAADFVMFTGLLYTLYGMVMRPYIDQRLYRSIVLVSWLVIYFSKMLIINYSCEEIMSEAKRTGNLICCSNDITKDSEFFDEVIQFSLQLKNNPLNITPHGLFTLGSKFLKGFVISVVTCLTIMIQVESEPAI